MPVPSTLIMEVAAFRIGKIRSENYSFAVGKKVRSKARLIQMRDLSLVRAVGIHHPNLQHGGANQILLEQREVIRFFFFGLRMISAIDDLPAVIRPERPAVITEFIRQPLNILSFGVHCVDVEIAVTHGSKDRKSTRLNS